MSNYKQFAFLCLCLMIAIGATAQNRKKKVAATTVTIHRVDTVYVVDTVVKMVKSKPIVFNDLTFSAKNHSDRNLDSLVEALFTQKSIANSEFVFGNYVFSHIEEDNMPFREITDSLIKSRFGLIYSHINLPYHPSMRTQIAKYLSSPRTMSLLFQRGLYYLPIFEEELRANDMPLELKYLPVIESSLSAGVISRAGAGGLWQFVPQTAKRYGLRVTSNLDERLDPYKSTAAAVRYLKDLYKIYNNWTLVIAAYNCGEGNVNRALKKVPNAKSYWDIYNYLPAATRDYVPAFIAVNYVFNFYRQHHIEFETPSEYFVVDSITIRDHQLDLKRTASLIGMKYETLRSLNPQYLSDVVPAAGRELTLVLPLSYISRFEEKRDEIFAKDSLYLQAKKLDQKVAVLDNQTIVHTVSKGETLSGIAKKYGVTVAKIVSWNSLSSAHVLKLGQKLKIVR